MQRCNPPTCRPRLQQAGEAQGGRCDVGGVSGTHHALLLLLQDNEVARALVVIISQLIDNAINVVPDPDPGPGVEAAEAPVCV